MNYQSFTIEELISFYEGGDSHATTEIARRVSEGLLDSYEQTIHNLEDKIEHQDSEYDDLLEVEVELNNTIKQFTQNIYDLEDTLEDRTRQLYDEIADLKDNCCCKASL